MRIEQISLYLISLPLREAFVTSYGRETDKTCILVGIHTQGAEGWGECAAGPTPFYLEETNETAWHILRDFLIPALLGEEIGHPDEIRARLRHVRRHTMAKAALECAVWDAWSRERGLSLATALGGTASEVEAGISIGLQPTESDLLCRVERALADGYRRVKLKIKPGEDAAPLAAVRRAFGDILLTADANSSYSLEDLDRLRALDSLGLAMIEQPLGVDDIVDHAVLQARMETPLCLDESVRSFEDARKAIELGACRAINVKPGRVGGLAEARDIARLATERGITAWCGGMLETGVGRVANLALMSLSTMHFPGDTGPSERYFAEDVIEPPVRFVRPGILPVPSAPGLGAEPRTDRIRKRTLRTSVFVARG